MIKMFENVLCKRRGVCLKSYCGITSRNVCHFVCKYINQKRFDNYFLNDSCLHYYYAIGSHFFVHRLKIFMNFI